MKDVDFRGFISDFLNGIYLASSAVEDLHIVDRLCIRLSFAAFLDNCMNTRRYQPGAPNNGVHAVLIVCSS